jgi:hypothetical protein
MADVAICTANVVIPALGVRIVFEGERLEYPLECSIQHLSVCLPLLIHLHLRTIAVIEWDQ